jgi:hypothetical protein
MSNLSSPSTRGFSPALVKVCNYQDISYLRVKIVYLSSIAMSEKYLSITARTSEIVSQLSFHLNYSLCNVLTSTMFIIWFSYRNSSCFFSYAKISHNNCYILEQFDKIAASKDPYDAGLTVSIVELSIFTLDLG